MFKWLAKQFTAPDDDPDSLGSEVGLRNFIEGLPTTVPSRTLEAIGEQFEHAIGGGRQRVDRAQTINDPQILLGLTTECIGERLAQEASLILCMTESHRAMINLTFNPPPRHVYLFREFLPRGEDKEIGDPYGGPLKVYEACRDEMVEAIPSLLEFLKKHYA